MDFVKSALKSGSGSSGSAGNTNQAAGGAGKEDYGDKGLSTPLLHTFDDLRNLRCTINVMLTIYSALDFIEKKSGHTLSRDQNEKITDGARGLYEKQTGYVFFVSPMLAPLSYITNC